MRKLNYVAFVLILGLFACKEKTKSKAESEKIYSDIKQTLKSQPEFDTIEQAKTKITNFIQK